MNLETLKTEIETNSVFKYVELKHEAPKKQQVKIQESQLQTNAE